MPYIETGKTRHCQVCGNLFKVTGPNHKTCKKLTCKRTVARRALRKYRESLLEIERNFNARTL